MRSFHPLDPQKSGGASRSGDAGGNGPAPRFFPPRGCPAQPSSPPPPRPLPVGRGDFAFQGPSDLPADPAGLADGKGATPGEQRTSDGLSTFAAFPANESSGSDTGAEMPTQTYRKSNQIPSFARVHREAASR